MTSAQPADVRSAVWEALRAGDPHRAVELALARLETDDDPELRLVLGQWFYVTVQFDAARQQLEAAVRRFEQDGNRPRAALAASALGRLYADLSGNPVVARGWFRRADRLIAEETAPCVEEGWVAVACIGCGVLDPSELLAKADLALDLARRFANVDLEAKAMADRGLALVRLGRVAEGLKDLDEAMALVTSGAVHPVVGGQVMCDMLTACERTGDLGRAETWRRFLADQGILNRPGAGPLLSAHCDGAHGSLLCSTGRWQEAEAVLARGVANASMTYHKAVCVSALAEIRIRQGRLDDAERLLVGLEDRAEVVPALARFHQARGDYDLAAAVAHRGLRLVKDDQGPAVALLALLVDVELGRGDVAAAVSAASRLADLAAEAELPAIAAHAACARSRAAAATGDLDGALALLHDALVALGDGEPALLRAALHLELASLLAAHDRAAAVAEARAAAAVYGRVDAALPTGSARVFAALGVAVPTPPGWRRAEPQGETRDERRTATLAREGEGWVLTDGVAVARLRDTKGLSYLAELVRRPGVERHVLDLVDGQGMGGDAGPVLDAAAKAAYRRRLEQLRAHMDAADAVDDDEAMYRIQGEIDALAAELARAVGLGGRDRRAASVAERARLNVTRALRAATARIAELLPAAGADLDRDLRTGAFCSYQPGPGGVVWSVVPSAVNGRPPR